MIGETYETLQIGEVKVYCIDEITGFTLQIDDLYYYIDYDENEVSIDKIVDRNEKVFFDIVKISALPPGDCIEEQVAKYILAARE